METLLAYWRAPKPLRGNNALRKSRAALDCFALMAATLPSPSLPSSGVKGGVRSSGAELRIIALGAETECKERSKPIGDGVSASK